MNLSPLTLTGTRVEMQPLSLERHFEGLSAIGLDPELWELTLEYCTTKEALRTYYENHLAEQAQGRTLCFVAFDRVKNKIAGSTRYLSIDHKNQRLEIGSTWYGKEFQRTYVNTEAKYLLMRHAFETLGCVRVELKTNVLNSRSRNAMNRIGCTEEGTLRKHAVNSRGTWRDTIYYSVLDNEWPRTKAHQEALISAQTTK